ncbi:uncharacterized protein [Rutidosis leptorrhynchoides]|uniref:uncharacterized protein n=1 Tax=Rutidosis leptorrhynchoides TaxID=125765 RepID=UPI003A994EFB
MDSSQNTDSDNESQMSDCDLELIEGGYNVLNVLEWLEMLDNDDAAENSRIIIRRRRLNRDRISIGNRLFNDYFSGDLTFSGDYFKKRFRMSRSLFIRIDYAILNHVVQPLPRKPTEDDIRRLHAKHSEMHGFSGMLGSLDCMYWP